MFVNELTNTPTLYAHGRRVKPIRNSPHVCVNVTIHERIDDPTRYESTRKTNP
jgi:hypothetical protein